MRITIEGIRSEKASNPDCNGRSRAARAIGFKEKNKVLNRHLDPLQAKLAKTYFNIS